jgi:aspartate kinase
MKVFKFGGAALKDATGIQNIASIISAEKDDLVVVVSAMGKTTNALETIFQFSHLKKNYATELSALKSYHSEIVRNLFSDQSAVTRDIEAVFEALERLLKNPSTSDAAYDQVISKGEIVSSLIVNHYLNTIGINSQWIDARNYIVTDDNFREGKVNWLKTNENINALEQRTLATLFLTQGFIGATADGQTTTLGREGSDFSAAIFAYCLNASSVTIWKDVPGVMTADPKRIPEATVFKELPFKEAAEMTYYGASVIHPKTIKPLANKGIPLFVKNFIDPTLPGTKIHECTVHNLPPLVVFKENQCLISCKVTDYAFVHEQQLEQIFSALTTLNAKINMMQNSAISFSFCIDFRENKIIPLIEKLQEHFEVYYNTGLTLITVKNYDDASFERYRKNYNVLMEQSSRSTLQVLVKL